jgi:hypothetical protein
MNRLLKSLKDVLGFLGRGASPVDGMYFVEHSRPVVAACALNSCSPAALVEKKFRAGYRVLM